MPARTDVPDPAQQLAALVRSVRDYSIFMLDLQGYVRTWNEGARLAKGYEAEEIIGEHFSRFYTPEDAAAGRPQMLLARALRDGRVEDEGWRVRKDGTKFWANVVISAIRDDLGALIGFSKITRDLTERRDAMERLRQSEERFRLIIESVQDYAIFRLSADGHVASWNVGAERIKGYRADEIVGRHFSVFYEPDDVASGVCERKLQVAAREGRHEDEGWRVRKDGSRFWANVVITALRDPRGELVGFAKVTRDMTQRRALEQERIRTAKAEEAVRLRDEFLSIASHELKTPLTALQLQLETLAMRVAALDGRLAAKLDAATASSRRLGTLVETLLDVSRVATGRLVLERQTLDLATLVRDLVERLRHAAEDARCEITVEAPEHVVGSWDGTRLEQVLMNLLANAIKYGRERRIDVGLTADANHATLVVSDRGPGIAEADRERIFGRFERASSMRHHGGLGLGLYISREIVTAHGGSIEAANRPDGGACFTVRLPLADGATERSEGQAPR